MGWVTVLGSTVTQKSVGEHYMDSTTLRIAQQIRYPPLTWQAAHLLSRTRAGQNKVEDAFTTARLAADTIEALAARIPTSALQQTFLAWHRVQSVREDLDRFRRA